MTILEKIFETKREEVAASKSILNASELRSIAADAEPRRGFLSALRSGNTSPSLIAEVKKASPSQGLIVQRDFDPIGIAQTYEANGATCLSVLTDVQYFKGAPEYLTQVHNSVEIPLLRKDFVFDEYQLDEAIVWGADCVLLIVAGLEQGLLHDLYGAAKSRGLDVLVEVHDEAETEVAMGLNPDLIGINNRDLSTFETDIRTTEKLLGQIPKEIFVVSESALHSRSDVELVHSFGARAVLIGTAFCESEDIGAKVREVMGI